MTITMTRQRAAAILGVPANADATTVKKAYRKEMMRFHPDRMTGKSEAEVEAAKESYAKADEAFKYFEKYGYTTSASDSESKGTSDYHGRGSKFDSEYYQDIYDSWTRAARAAGGYSAEGFGKSKWWDHGFEDSSGDKKTSELEDQFASILAKGFSIKPVFKVRVDSLFDTIKNNMSEFTSRQAKIFVKAKLEMPYRFDVARISAEAQISFIQVSGGTWCAGITAIDITKGDETVTIDCSKMINKQVLASQIEMRMFGASFNDIRFVETAVGKMDLIVPFKINPLLVMLGSFAALHYDDSELKIRIPKMASAGTQLRVGGKGVNGGNINLKIEYDVPSLDNLKISEMAAISKQIMDEIADRTEGSDDDEGYAR